MSGLHLYSLGDELFTKNSIVEKYKFKSIPDFAYVGAVHGYIFIPFTSNKYTRGRGWPWQIIEE
jgi:hypothetical protein